MSAIPFPVFLNPVLVFVPFPHLQTYVGDWNKIIDHVLIFKSLPLDRNGQSIWSVYFLNEEKKPSGPDLHYPWKLDYSKGLQVGLPASSLFLL